MRIIISIFQAFGKFFKSIWFFLEKIFEFMGKFLVFIASNFHYLIGVIILGFAMWFMYKLFETQRN